MIVRSGQAALAELVAEHVVTHAAIGTNNAVATPDDVGISNAVVVPVVATHPEPGTVRFTWTVPSDVADGMMVWEEGLLRSDGSLFARRVRRRPIEKAELELLGEWTLYF